MHDDVKVILMGMIITGLVPIGMVLSGILIIPDPDQYGDKALKSLLYEDLSENNDVNATPAIPTNTTSMNSIIDVVKTDDFPMYSEIIHYSVDPVPAISNKSIPINALKKSIQTWEKYNPNLKFIESDNSNIKIRWQLNPSADHVGLATCESDIRGTILRCFVDISIGGTSCNGNYFQTRENDLSNVIMHELGHTFGLEHTLDQNHLMYSTKSPQDPFDTLGYSIPEKFPDLNSMADSMQEIINVDLVKINKEKSTINEEQVGYNQLLKEYQQSRISQEMKDRLDMWAERITNKINENNNQIENVNALINERNILVEEINAISNEKSCHAGFGDLEEIKQWLWSPIQ